MPDTDISTAAPVALPAVPAATLPAQMEVSVPVPDAPVLPAIPMDASDSAVVMLAWLVTFGVRRVLNSDTVNSLSPLIAFAAALGVRALIEQNLSADVVLHALASAGVVSLVHSQVREGSKVVQKRKAAKTASVPAVPPPPQV